MSDFRYDPVFGHWVCIAESRQDRPVEFQQTVQRKPGLECPFCRGNERLTPEPLATAGQDADGGWLARAIPNKYPVFTPNADDGDSDAMPPGRQEVIVVSPRHVTSLAELDERELAASARLFRRGIDQYWNDSGIAHVSLFMNCRPFAGASIEHAHFQLIGSPICTAQVRRRLSEMCKPHGPGRLWEREVQRERSSDARLVDETGELTVFCPFASRFSGQLRFAPRRPDSILDWDEAAWVRLARQLAHWTGVVERVLEDPAWNLVFYLPPTDLRGGPWFIDLIPRFPQVAGFELATECWVNPMSPETAARRYRG